MIDMLFQRSSYFRQLLISDFKEVLDLIIGIYHILPPPQDISKLLREKSLSIVEEWYKNYSQYYKQVINIYNFHYINKKKSYI